jgi:hypothetical protein
MIRDMLESLEKALAQGMTRDEARQAAEVAVRQKYAGERVYVAALPKQARAVQLARLEKRTQVQMALSTGLSVRQIRRIRNGK